jgi:hypothetical protein
MPENSADWLLTAMVSRLGTLPKITQSALRWRAVYRDFRLG